MEKFFFFFFPFLMKNYHVALNLFKTIIMQDRERVWNWKEVVFISHSPQFIM